MEWSEWILNASLVLSAVAITFSVWTIVRSTRLGNRIDALSDEEES
jgi:hypothetical protein